jgi:hypothetical protein
MSINKLNMDVQYIIIQFLSPADLIPFSTCDTYRFQQIRTNKIYPKLWKALCHDLWKDKVYVPRFILKEEPSLKTYFHSIKDSKRQTFLDENELCEQHFHFRFRLQAGYYWYSKDSSFIKGDTPMYRYFKKSTHTFGHVPPPSLLTSAEHQKFTLNKDYIKISNFDFLVDDPNVVAHLPPTVKWRITKSKLGKKGQFIKVNQWPSLYIKRNTSTDWGWTLEEDWVKYQTCSPASLSKSREFMYDPIPEYDSDDDDEPEIVVRDDIDTGVYEVFVNAGVQG